ncbi:hypothetical protein A9Q81_15490 [Gammaproteobacteria bacterium 42_54_T18]|nr:hypothetical protein A9Q81_15490 [Gammaproteobacteria bacterium 42_54_T18]
MIKETHPRKEINRRYPLWLQVFIALILCLIIVNMLTSVVLREVGSGFLFQQVDNQSKDSFSLLAATALDAVISEDQPILNSIANQTLSNSENIIEIVIRNESDSILVKKIQNIPYPVHTIRTYNYPIIYENEEFGSITISWNLDPIYAEIERQITFVRYFISTLLIILCALIIQAFYWLTIRPVNRISRYLTSLKEGDREPLTLSFIASKELEFLANAANDLFSEITQKEIREEQLIKTRQELQISHDNALCSSQSKSNFLAVMSHEIRTPMNAVLGILGLLKDTPLTPKQRLLVQTGRSSGELLLTIINDILDFSKMESNQLSLEETSFNLHELLEQTVQLLSHQARIKSIDLILSITPDLPIFVNGDPDRVRQILINLINNALKFTPKGNVTVIASKKKEKTDFWIIDFSVIDTGIGISTDLPYSLFEHFTMADPSHSRSHEGTGLGLAICKHLVSLMKGDIFYTSQLGVGTTFTFSCEFGISNEIPNSISNQQHQENFSFNANIRTLLVEDNPANQFVIKQILNHAGLNVDLASNGQEALDILSSHPYDVILMDISMPIMDGITTTQKIRQSNSIYSNIPIIALTAHALAGDRERYLHSGMNDYLQKPINKNATLRCIDKWTKNISSISSSQPIMLEQHKEKDIYVNYNTVNRLVKKTSESHAFELITLYISDTHQRLTQMENAQKSLDTSEFTEQLEIIYHSSVTHGNTALHSLAKKFLDLHKSNNLGSLYLANMEFQQTADISLSELSDLILSRYNQSNNG